MVKTIQVYIMSKEVKTRQSLDGSTLAAAVFAHSRTHDCSMKEISKTERAISEEDKAALKLVKELAAEKNLKFRVIDIASLRGKLKARLKGVKATPTIIVDKKRLIGVSKKEDFEAFLSSAC